MVNLFLKKAVYRRENASCWSGFNTSSTW